jgi:hypothetical protein
MKWTFNVVKTIVTPIEIEAENFADAIKKAYAQIPDVDTDHGRISYMVDTTPSDSLIPWCDQ